MSRKAIISTAVVPIYKKPSFSSEMVTQALVWESIEILEEFDNWAYVLMEDKYNGWLHSFYFCQSKIFSSNYQYIINRVTPIYRELGKISTIISILSFGSRVPVCEKIDNWCKIYLPEGGFAYIDNQATLGADVRESIISLARSLQGVPYLWGGKSSFGYDCSGFVQMVLKVANVSIERDSSLQIDTKGFTKINIDQAQPGDLIFFSDNNIINHVGFIIGEGKIIHCSGQVKIESIIEGTHSFNDKLSKLPKIIMSIGGLLG